MHQTKTGRQFVTLFTAINLVFSSQSVTAATVRAIGTQVNQRNLASGVGEKLPATPLRASAPGALDQAVVALANTTDITITSAGIIPHKSQTVA